MTDVIWKYVVSLQMQWKKYYLNTRIEMNDLLLGCWEMMGSFVTYLKRTALTKGSNLTGRSAAALVAAKFGGQQVTQNDRMDRCALHSIWPGCHLTPLLDSALRAPPINGVRADYGFSVRKI